MLRINFVTYKECLYKECHGTVATTRQKMINSTWMWCKWPLAQWSLHPDRSLPAERSQESRLGFDSCKKLSDIFFFFFEDFSINYCFVVMSTIPKRKYKRSDIEANYRNETKTFWCVPKKEVERFYLVQKLWIEIITFWCVLQNLLNQNLDVSM